MELGRIAEIDNAKLNTVEKVQKVSETTEKNKLIQDEEYKKALGSNTAIEANEVILDNIRFGYNKSSRDFFVKVTKGEAEYKYPTEDMMKVKAFILQELEASQNKN